MVGGTASWHFLDVESGHIPGESSSSVLPDGGEGRIVALGATPLAQSGGWASRAVVSIVAAWAAEGRRIFLMDLGLDRPSLHELLTLPNEEGVSDAFLYGASIERIAQPALDDALFFASAGTATADPEEVLRHPRWHDLAGGFSETDATLVLFLPTDIPGAGNILGLATDVIFLAAEGESPDAFLGAASEKVLATLGPLSSAWRGTEEIEAHGGETTTEGPGSAVPPWVLQSPTEAEGLAAVGEGVGALDEEALAERFELAEGFLPRDSEEDTEPGVAGELPAGQGGDGSGWISQDEFVTAPDFGAEFADLPPLEGETGGMPEPAGPGEYVAGFGGDLVSGSSFDDHVLEARDLKAVGFDAPGTGDGLDRSNAEAWESPVPPDEAPGARAPAVRPPRPRPRRPIQRKRSLSGMVVLILALAAITAAAAGTLLGVFSLPGLGFLQGVFRDLPDPPLVLPGPQPNEPLLRFSLELFRYQENELSHAEEMRDELRSRLPGVLFAVVPDDSRGAVSHALLAGPAESLLEVESLREVLAGVITREDPESWRIRETPRAFHLGEWGTLEEAREYLARIESDGIPGYVLYATYPGGTDGYIVFAGAYQGVADARPMQRILHESGRRDVPLVERRGRLPE